MPVGESVKIAGGFEKIPSNIEIIGKFSQVNIFSISKVNLHEYSTASIDQYCIEEEHYCIAIGNKISDLYYKLLKTDFRINNETLKTSYKIDPPYLLVIIKSDNDYICSKDDFWKVESKNITIFDGFQDARDDLKKESETLLPKIISSLTISLHKNNNIIRFDKIADFLYGKRNTGENIIIQEIILGSPNVYCCLDLKSTDIENQLSNMKKIMNSYHEKVNYFLYLALQEADHLKKFLYLFYAMEIHVHQEFKKVKQNPQKINSLVDKKAIEVILDRQTLLQKFYWCSLTIWKEINSTEIDQFKNLKIIRDKISHGEKILYNELPIKSAELLCIKILSEVNGVL